MSSFIQDIYFKTIDFDSVENVEDNPEAVTFDIVLNTPPTQHWIEEFEYIYARAQYGLKPPVHIVEDRMRVMYLPRYSEELQGFVSFLSQIIDRATQEARRTIEILQTDERQKLKSEFRETLAQLELPRAGRPQPQPRIQPAPAAPPPQPDRVWRGV